MLELLWGVKTTALFDVWSIEHVLSGISVGSAVCIYHNHKNAKHPPQQHCALRLHLDLMGVLFVAYAWETLEHYLETGLAGDKVAYWFQGVEFWANRLITDPLLLVLGYFIAKRFPQLSTPARVLSVMWLITHIFAFPHSMHLHDLL